MKCQKDPTCSIFLKRELFKDYKNYTSKNYIPIQYNFEEREYNLLAIKQ